MKNNDNAIIPASKLTKPIDFGTVEDAIRDDDLENETNLMEELEDVPMNMKGLAESLM